MINHPALGQPPRRKELLVPKMPTMARLANLDV